MVLALFAIFQQKDVTPSFASRTQIAYSQPAIPTSASTQGHEGNTPTILPIIQPSPDEKTPSPLGVAADELKGVQVHLGYPWSGKPSVAMRNILDEYNRTNPWGITVIASDYDGFGRLDEAVESALFSDTIPDVLVDYGYQARHWDYSNAITDLNPYVNDPVWGLSSDEQSDFYASFWSEDLVTSADTNQPRRLGIPYYRSAFVLFYNQSWGRELGYTDPPTTVEQLRVRACAATDIITERKEKADLGKGGWLITTQPGVLVGWIYAFGGDITQPDGSGYSFDTPATLRAFNYLKSLQSSGCAWHEVGADSEMEFANRHALFMVGSLEDIPAQSKAFKKAGNTDEWMVIPFPSRDKAVVVTYGPSLLLTHSTPVEQLASWLVIDWLISPSKLAELAEALGAYPTRLSALSDLSDVTGVTPQWAQALELLPRAHSEPSIASWSMMQWALEDAMRQLFDPDFVNDQIPNLLENLANVAAEIYIQVR